MLNPIMQMKKLNVCGSFKRMSINSLFCFFITMLTIFTGAPKGTNAIVQHLCAKHNHHCVVKIPPCSSWTTKIAPLQRSELEKATQDVNAVAL